MASVFNSPSMYRPFGTAPTPTPPTVATLTFKTITTSTLARLAPLTTADASKAWMRSSAINAVRAGNVDGCVELATWIYTSGWAASDAWAKSIGRIVAYYVLVAATICATHGAGPASMCAISTADAHKLYSHF